MFDAPHLFKSLRNNLLTGDFLVDDKIISFNDVRNTYIIDQKSTKARALVKITKVHKNPNSFQKMSVKLATQVLNDSMAAAIRTCYATGQMDSFIDHLDKLFDCLNFRSLKSSNPYKCALADGNIAVMDTSRNSLPMLKNMEKCACRTGKSSRPPSFDGLQQTIETVLQLYEDEKDSGVRYILTIRLNQDVLEIYFPYTVKRGAMESS